MKGLELAELYYHEFGAPMLKKHFPEQMGRITVGMVGPGSECFGFDDKISRDHDWGPGFSLWLTDNDYLSLGPALQKAYESLPKSFRGYGPRTTSHGENNRTGVCEIAGFYKLYTGLKKIPESLTEWFTIPEENLALVTNGKIFTDPLGAFTAWRDKLLGYYPEDVRLQRMGSCCMEIAQSGQYNLPRSLQRNEIFAARYDVTRFGHSVLALVFLLNRRYSPFYKWQHRAVRLLPILGESIYELITELAKEDNFKQNLERIENICKVLVAELKRQGLTDANSDFLVDHARGIRSRINNRKLRESFSPTSNIKR